VMLPRTPGPALVTARSMPGSPSGRLCARM
jgi:hypothetical protein